MKCRCNFEFCYKYKPIIIFCFFRCGKEYRAECFGKCHDINEVSDILSIGRNDNGNVNYLLI